jgi:hypothetical protein
MLPAANSVRRKGSGTEQSLGQLRAGTDAGVQELRAAVAIHDVDGLVSTQPASKP